MGAAGTAVNVTPARHALQMVSATVSRSAVTGSVEMTGAEAGVRPGAMPMKCAIRARAFAARTVRTASVATMAVEETVDNAMRTRSAMSMAAVAVFPLAQAKHAVPTVAVAAAAGARTTTSV